MRIGIDLMGGDNSPELLFEAVLLSAEQHPPTHTFVLLATQQIIDTLHVQLISSLANKNTARIEFHFVDSVIAMDEEPLSAVRVKKTASVNMGMRMLKKHHLDAFISSGNTGALIAAATLLLPMLPGISRAALLAILPTKKKPLAIIDIGGNLYCKAQNLIQFAQMAAAYQRCREGIRCPKIGLLNIGVESKKGTKEVRQAYRLLQELGERKEEQEGHAMEFVGNFEAREIFEGHIDVLVTDGFTGNILLKTTEGAASFMGDQFKSLAKEPSTKVSTKSAIEKLLKKFDYSEYPGAIVCGVEGIVIKCHGNATSRALYHSIEGAISLVERGLIKKIKASI